VPAALSLVYGLAAMPGRSRGGLAAGVRKLHPRGRALFNDGAADAAQGRDVLVFPDAEVRGADAPVRLNGGSLGEHQPRAAYRTAAKVDKVPVAGEAVVAGILAHRRDRDPVLKQQGAQAQRRKQDARIRHGTCLLGQQRS